jgi:hypothetical protein
MDDHHGVDCDWTFETNKYGMIGLRKPNQPKSANSVL